MSNILICDIDGVLADCSHRLHYLKEKNYEAFYSAENMIEDKMIDAGIELFNMLSKTLDALDVYLLTGRPERSRKITEMWLKYHDINYFQMSMRNDGDFRPSPEVKVELMKDIIESDQHCSSIYFIDDDPENVKAVCKAFPNTTGLTFGIKRMKNEEE